MATIKDVARLANVSVATVSRVMNNNTDAVKPATYQAVLQAMQELNYYPNVNARALSQQSSETIGIIVSDVSDPFFGAMIKAVEQVAYQTKNFLLIGNGYHDEERERKAIEELIRHRCEALVVHAKMLSDHEVADFMRKIPGMVLINRVIKGFESRCISLDDRHGGWLATRHLIEKGHRHIALLCSNHEISDAEDRLQGYKDALAEHNIAYDPRYVSYNAPDEKGGEQGMIELLEQSLDITGLVCYNDPMALGAMSVLYDNNINVPDKLSVIGFDDVHAALYARPKLTTVRYPIALMATQAAQLALSLAKDKPLPQTTRIFTPTLIRRHSVAQNAN